MVNKKKDSDKDEENYSADKLVISTDDDGDDAAADADEDGDDEADDDEEEASDEELDEDEDDEEEEEEEEEDDDEDADEHEDEDADPLLAAGAEEQPDDPYWWTPHAVLATLLVIGLVGFFGFFNKWLSPIFAATPSHDAHSDSAQSAEPAQPAKTVTVDARNAKQPDGDAAVVYGAKHILVQYKGSMRADPKIERTKEEAKTRADDVAKKVAATKASATREEDWRKLVTEFSDEPGSDKRGGDLGRFKKGAMVPQFTAGVETLKVGDTSQPVETPFGYHVIWRTQ